MKRGKNSIPKDAKPALILHSQTILIGLAVRICKCGTTLASLHISLKPIECHKANHFLFHPWKINFVGFEVLTPM
jgi:hypothetical protein